MDEWENWRVLSGCMRLVVEAMFAVYIRQSTMVYNSCIKGCSNCTRC